MDESHQRRALGDLGIDVRPWDSTVLELNYTDYHLTDTGFPGWFTYGQKIQLPSAPDPLWVGYGQSYLGTDLRTETGTARIKHDFNSDWHLGVGGFNQHATRNINTSVNNLTKNPVTTPAPWARRSHPASSSPVTPPILTAISPPSASLTIW